MRSPLVALFTLLSFLLLVVSPRSAFAEDDQATAQAKQYFESGRAAYLAGDYASAIAAFQSAQALRPSPILDYNIGLSYEGLGDAGSAYASYQRYLTAKPDAQNRAEVEQRMSALAVQLSKPPAGGPSNPPAGGAVTQQPSSDPYGQPSYTPPARPAPAPARKKSSNWWIVFPILGGVLVTGLIIWAVAANTHCGPPDCNGTYLRQPLTLQPGSALGGPAGTATLARPSANPNGTSLGSGTLQLVPGEGLRF